jgi:TRAP-type C4-dicarboxylate transport system permease small subunit
VSRGSPAVPPGLGTRVATGARRAADAVGIALFAALLATFVVQVVARFAFDRPLPWTDELAVILYIAIVMWGAAVLVPWREHVAMGLAVSALPRGLQRGAVFVGAAATAGLAASALPATLDYLRFVMREPMPVLGWPQGAVYAPFALLLATIVVRGALAAWSAVRDRLPDDGDAAGPVR